MRDCVVGLSFLCCVAASAQQPGASAGGALGGQVISQLTQTPIPAAVVHLAPLASADPGRPLSFTTDSTGRFLFATLDSGTYLLEVDAIGYAQGTWRLRIPPGRTVQHAFDLVPLTVKLPPVVVESTRTARGRLADFERRRAAKVGYFLTQQDIEKLNASSLSDVLARVRGVTLDCAGGTCIPRMARSQPGCDPQFFIDGTESTSYFARNTPPHDIIGLEVYRGPSELPAEFTGSNSGCGVIVIWTKSAP